MDGDELSDINESLQELRNSVDAIKEELATDYGKLSNIDENLSDISKDLCKPHGIESHLSQIVYELEIIKLKTEEFERGKINAKFDIFSLDTLIGMVVFALMIGFSVALFLHK